ncbi:CHAT domain-containing protein [Laspinema sp. D1]|uniref:CHAT domain-containing protein n=1 Tax=Laspinema palackyanum D2a TaxID=2953684 RepID=A0ABT2MWQ2_9CYAN|nr:CHAT domain-containing protein [Laspinema sp. D2a]
MARKWHPFFSKVQSFLNQGWKFILLSIFATITILNLQGVSPVVAHQAGAETVAQTPISNGESRLEEGTQLYESLRFAESETAWQAAVGLLSGEEKALGFSYMALAQLRQSKLDDAETSIQESIRLLNQVTTPGTSERKQTIHARILTTSAQVNLARNQPELAAHALEQLAEATAIYEQLNQEKWMIASQINQAQAMQQLGMYREALKTLKNLEDPIINHSEPEIRLSGILNLGKTYRAIGVLDQSYCVLQLGQGNPEIVLELGNTAQAIGKRIKDQLDSITDEQTDPFFTEEGTQTCESPVESKNSINALYFYKKAQEFYEQVWTLPAVKTETQVQAMVNHLSLALDLKDVEGLEDQTSQLERQANELAPQVLQLIEILPLNREKVYDRIHLARSLTRLNREWSQNQLETALAEARELADKRAQAYAIGELGWMKQQQGNWTEAEQWTRQAVAITPPDAIDIRYQWEWQLGQILKEEGRTEEAIRHYTEAVDLLQRVRQNLVAIAANMGEMNADLQFDFRDRVEPVYRELVGLLLDPQGNEVTRQDHIQTALGVIELLQVAELENFLQCDLQPEPQIQLARSVAEAKQKVAEKLELIFQKDPNYALIYPMILPNKLEVILALAEQPLVHHSILKPAAEFKDTINNLKSRFKDRSQSEQLHQLSDEVYQWLIEPWAARVQSKPLVFILDIPFQTIPMAGLYDKNTKRYLIEDHEISLMTTLQLLIKKPANNKLIQVLSAGITQGRMERNIAFNDLFFVENELTNISNEFPETRQFFESSFTKNNIKDTIENNSFSILHLATHGHFSSQRYFTFILAGDGIIDLTDFNNLFRSNQNAIANQIQLLVLSACKTAEGDRKSALGIAGVTVNSRINNTIASLWSVNDESTSILMNQFYKNLNQLPESYEDTNVHISQALRQAQKFVIEQGKRNPRYRHRHPYHWASFILLKNAL